MKYCLAIDIGSSSGRHFLGHIEGGKLCIEEIYRFDNVMTKQNGHIYWDIERLFENVCAGIRKCAELGKIPETVAIDTWGVDYVLLDGNDRLIDGALAHRDSRTVGIPEKVYEHIGKRELYDRTGCSEQNLNTIFQLYEDKLSGRINTAETMLFIPCYLNYLLTGRKLNEYTFASTTGLVNAHTSDWDFEIIKRLGLPEKLFSKLHQPGEIIGKLKPKIAGFDCTVILPASHDTASAVVSVPVDESLLFISSGTWSLFGIETDKPYTGTDAEDAGFTNEGGINHTVRFIQNLTGLWLMQSIKRELCGKYSYNELMKFAENSNYNGIAEVNDERFISPDSMLEAVNRQLIENGFATPATLGDTINAVYRGLAKAYSEAADQLEKITGKYYDTICIVGGGSKDTYLNRLTSEFSGRRVVKGVTEATAIGNLAVQLIFVGELKNIVEARHIIADSYK